MQDGFQTANTALIYHANKLLVLHEGDLPYAVRHAALITCMQAVATCCATLHLHLWTVTHCICIYGREQK